MKRGVNSVSIKSNNIDYTTANEKRAKIINDIYYKDDDIINELYAYLKRIDLRKSKILPTPFAVNSEHKKKEYDFSFGSKTFSNEYDTTSRRYSQIVTDLNTIMYNCNKIIVHKLLQYIQANLVQDSNKIIFNINEVANIIKSDRGNVADAVVELCAMNIIAKTDCQGTYIINHNYIFNGDIVSFEKTYNSCKYDRRLVTFNGKICINPNTIKVLKKMKLEQENELE